jgi:acetyl-CoA C-acetyltransferase
MSGITDKIAIVGMGCTKFGEHWDKGLEDLIVEAALEAFSDAQIEAKDIEAAWFGMQYAIGTARGTPLAYALKLDYIPVTRVENACCTGTDAFRNACFGVASGMYETALVVGVEKIKDSGLSGLPVSYAPIWGSRVEPPVPAPVQFALAATRYFANYGLSYEEGKRLLAKIAVKNHKNGVKHPKAHLRREIGLEDALKAPLVAWPLGLYDCCPVSDGAAVAIITTPENAKKLGRPYTLVKGMGLACGARQALLDDAYDMVHFEETVRAAKQAYEQAGVTNPREEISLAVVHDCFTITELIIYEDLGFSPRGRAKEDVESGFFEIDGGLPVNTDGGLKCFGHPIGASGLRMLYEVHNQLLGRPLGLKVENPRLGLTHNLGGHPGHFTCAVCVLGQGT